MMKVKFVYKDLYFYDYFYYICAQIKTLLWQI